MLGTRAISILLDRLSDILIAATKISNLSGIIGTADSTTGTTTAASTEEAYDGLDINTITLVSPSKAIAVYNLDTENVAYFKAGDNWIPLAAAGSPGDSLENIAITISSIQVMGTSGGTYRLLVTI